MDVQRFEVALRARCILMMGMARMLLLLCLLLATAARARGAGEVEHVVVIGLDGCRPEAIQQAGGPFLKELLQQAAWTWKASAVLPSVTHVNFASILTGSTPEQHGIAAKEWNPGDRRRVAVPTIFEVVAQGGRKAAGFLGHEKLYPAEPEKEHPLIQIEHSPYGARAVAPLAAKYLVTEKPAFCFVYMGDLDGAGHKYGWLSPEQLARMSDIDSAIGVIVGALKDAGLWARTLLIITADHGGHGKSHSAGTLEDVTIPWIAAGPRVEAGEIQSPVRNMDTAATAAHALGIGRPAAWSGRVVVDVGVGR